MIKLTKGTLPDGLRQEHDNALAELSALIDAASEIPAALTNRYRLPAIKALIRNETRNKCAYCEAFVSHVYPGDVEHIKPKSLFPKLSIDFANLTYACFECNNRKRDYYSEVSPLIDPYSHEPSDHLFAFGPFLFERVASNLGETTLARLGLNRSDLVGRRLDLIKRVQRLVALIASRTGPARDALIEDLEELSSPGAEYSMTTTAFIRASEPAD